MTWPIHISGSAKSLMFISKQLDLPILCSFQNNLICPWKQVVFLAKITCFHGQNNLNWKANQLDFLYPLYPTQDIPILSASRKKERNGMSYFVLSSKCAFPPPEAQPCQRRRILLLLAGRNSSISPVPVKWNCSTSISGTGVPISWYWGWSSAAFQEEKHRVLVTI